MDLLMDSFAEKPKEKKTESKDKKPAAQKPAVQRVSLLDAKVLQNNGIVLKRFRYLLFCVAFFLLVFSDVACRFTSLSVCVDPYLLFIFIFS